MDRAGLQTLQAGRLAVAAHAHGRPGAGGAAVDGDCHCHLVAAVRRRRGGRTGRHAVGHSNPNGSRRCAAAGKTLADSRCFPAWVVFDRRGLAEPSAFARQARKTGGVAWLAGNQRPDFGNWHGGRLRGGKTYTCKPVPLGSPRYRGRCWRRGSASPRRPATARHGRSRCRESPPGFPRAIVQDGLVQVGPPVAAVALAEEGRALRRRCCSRHRHGSRSRPGVRPRSPSPVAQPRRTPAGNKTAPPRKSVDGVQVSGGGARPQQAPDRLVPEEMRRQVQRQVRKPQTVQDRRLHRHPQGDLALPKNPAGSRRRSSRSALVHRPFLPPSQGGRGWCWHRKGQSLRQVGMDSQGVFRFGGNADILTGELRNDGTLHPCREFVAEVKAASKRKTLAEESLKLVDNPSIKTRENRSRVIFSISLFILLYYPYVTLWITHPTTKHKKARR